MAICSKPYCLTFTQHAAGSTAGCSAEDCRLHRFAAGSRELALVGSGTSMRVLGSSAPCWGAWLTPPAAAAWHPGGSLCQRDASTSLHRTVPSGIKAELCTFSNKMNALLGWWVELYLLLIICRLLLFNERDHFPMLQRRHWPQKL